MSTLFYQLIFNRKTKRWFELLAVLEESEQVTASLLVEQTHFGRRTIMTDIKELKAYFGETIQLIGDEKGYHFSLIDPQGYYEKKQCLLAEKRLFLFIDQLAAGKRVENHQWGAYLDLPSASFQRIKHRLQEILTQHYGCQLVSKTNELYGEEASIRQFLYDFYFTLPLYTATVAPHICQLQKETIALRPGVWQLDPTLFNQWGQIAKQRIDQGYRLPEKETDALRQAALADALDRQVTVSLPPREKAALFLLSLNEAQFFNPLEQKLFIRTFSSPIEEQFPILSDEELAYQLFETMLFLIDTFFQLPRANAYQKGTDQSEKPNLLDALFHQFLREKEQLRKTVYVTYQLEGSVALKRWIQEEVMRAFQALGRPIIVVLFFLNPEMDRPVQVTNCFRGETAQTVLLLPKIPNRATIRQSVSQFLSGGKSVDQ